MKSVEQQFKDWLKRSNMPLYLQRGWQDELREVFDAGRRSAKAEQRRHAVARGNVARKEARHEP